MKIIAVSLTLLLAGCGFDWFPSNSATFRNTSTAFTTTSTAKRALFTGNSSSAKEPSAASEPR